MGFLWFGRDREIDIWNDVELYDDKVRKTAMKRIAIETVIGFIARTIIQSEFRIKKDNKFIKDDLYYWFNVKPNKNQSAAEFWERVIYKLVYDGECLIIKSYSNDLLIADDFERKEYAVYEDIFSNVYVKDFEFTNTFRRDEVVYLKYGNEKLKKLVDELYFDYGELLGRLIDFQLRKNQIRATVDIDSTFSKGDEASSKLQSFIDKTYKAIKDKAIAIIPQQKGLAYQEHSKDQSSGASVEEINKITDGFLDQVANAVGLPPSLLKGDLADSDKIARNYMKFCVDPIITIISSEFNMQFVEKKDYLKGDKIDVRRVSYRDIFDLAVAVDKLRSSSVMNGNELRDAIGLDASDDPIHDEFIMTKNYDSIEGGEDE